MRNSIIVFPDIFSSYRGYGDMQHEKKESLPKEDQDLYTFFFVFVLICVDRFQLEGYSDKSCMNIQKVFWLNFFLIYLMLII